MLMRPNKAEAAVHGCHCPGDMAVRMRKVLVRPWVGVRVCHLLFIVVFRKGCKLAEEIWERDKVQQIKCLINVVVMWHILQSPASTPISLFMIL